LEAVVGGLIVVVALLSMLVVGLLRSHAVILRGLADLGVDLGAITDPGAFASPGRTDRAPAPDQRPAHDIAGVTLQANESVLVSVATAPSTMLAFLTSSCLTCRSFWDAFREAPNADLPDDIRLVVIAHDDSVENLSLLRALAGPDLDVVLSSTAWAQYGVPGSPYFVLVDRDAGVVGEGTGPDWAQVRRLLAFDGVTTAIAAPRRRSHDDRNDSVRVDNELLRAGLRPGDPSLYEHT
jgi:hypothetical protein